MLRLIGKLLINSSNVGDLLAWTLSALVAWLVIWAAYRLMAATATALGQRLAEARAARELQRELDTRLQIARIVGVTR